MYSFWQRSEAPLLIRSSGVLPAPFRLSKAPLLCLPLWHCSGVTSALFHHYVLLWFILHSRLRLNLRFRSPFNLSRPLGHYWLYVRCTPTSLSPFCFYIPLLVLELPESVYLVSGWCFSYLPIVVMIPFHNSIYPIWSSYFTIRSQWHLLLFRVITGRHVIIAFLVLHMQYFHFDLIDHFSPKCWVMTPTALYPS